MVQRYKFSIELKNSPPDLSGEPNLYNKDQRTFPCGRDVNIEENHIQQGGIFDYTTHGAANKTIGGNKKILRYEIEEK